MLETISMSVSHRHMNTNDVEHLDDFEEDIGDETIHLRIPIYHGTSKYVYI